MMTLVLSQGCSMGEYALSEYQHVVAAEEVATYALHRFIALLNNYERDIVDMICFYVGIKQNHCLMPQCFFGCTSLKTVVLPRNIRSIYFDAFMACNNLQSITLSPMITSIGESAFKGCSALKCIDLPETLQFLGKRAFENSGLQRICLPSTMTVVSYNLFTNCDHLTTVVLPPQLTTIDERAFYGCVSLKSIELPAGLTRIYDFAFARSGLESIVIPDGVLYICIGAFQDCEQLVSVQLSTETVRIADMAFKNCSSLESIVFPPTLRSVGVQAFDSCSKLCHVDFSRAVNLSAIHYKAFVCTSLSHVDLYACPRFLDEFAFSDVTTFRFVHNHVIHPKLQ